MTQKAGSVESVHAQNGEQGFAAKRQAIERSYLLDLAVEDRVNMMPLNPASRALSIPLGMGKMRMQKSQRW